MARTGTYNLDETLRVTGAGRIDASNASQVGITLNICVPPATASASCDLILDTPAPLVTPPAIGGGQIEANDLAGNDFASPITIRVSRDLLMHANSAILANNTVSGGRGGNIAITTGRNMTMNAGSTISVTGTGSSGNSPAGSVTLTVGNYPNAPGVGAFTMDSTSQILANSPLASAGPIVISAGLQMDINGLVESSSRLSGVPNQPPGGGPITLLSACRLTVGDSGMVSSEGKDPGADLVHLEGCDVFIYGIVRSNVVLAGGHSLPINPPNHCNLDTAAHPAFGPASPPANPSAYTGCVEIWANNIVIDNTGTHKGEVYADGVRTDTGGPKRSWIDLFAKRNITIIANTTGNYAVRANPFSATNQYGGLITVKSQVGKIVAAALVPGTVGLAFQANSTPGGGTGGDIIVQAGGAAPNGQLDFTADSVRAIGASSGGGPAGGHITVQSFNDTILGLALGELNAAGGGTAGTVTLTACVGDPATTYAGAVTGTRTNNAGICGGGPSFPTVANFVTGLTVTGLFTSRQGLWDTCGAPPTIPLITTVASAGGAIGTVLTDQATLSGGAAPTGNITFLLYGPNDATCTTAVFTSSLVPVAGNGTYTSTPGFTTVAAGTYRWRAFYSGDANNAPVSGVCDAANESADITPAPTTPAITTVASAGGLIGTVLTDQATLSGGAAPTGSITFELYGPNDATCTTAIFTSNAIPVAGNGTYTSAPGFTTVAAGTYRWRAFYSGDANNNAVSGVCDAANESADIAPPPTTPTIVTVASAGGLIGMVLTDQATLSGGTAPTGTITFVLYGPNDATCTTAIFTSNAIAVAGNGTYTSAPGFTTVAAGTYGWRAFYSGDANNNPVSGLCGAANESADITAAPATPTIATTASAGGGIGTVLTDQATLAGGTAPTGTITFLLYGPNDATCTTAIFTSNAIAVAGNGTYTSAPGFTTVAAGTYRWRAFYSGDANNNAVSEACDAANESADITLAPVTPTIATVASAGGGIGTVLTDQATLSGGTAPTGTITFLLYGPNDATCTTAIFTSNAIAVAGNGTYTSAPGFTTVAAGTYRWRAFYSGDANNNAVSGVCGAANESAEIVQSRTVPVIATVASAGGPLGTVLTDTAALGGGTAPTGTITFALYGPNDATCATVIFTSSAIPVNGNGFYTSAPGFTPTAPGTYRWRAFYSGDANNNPVVTLCNAPNESADITLGPTTPTIVTAASAGGPIGTVLTDQATLSGGVAPTGTITFVLYGPNDPTCSVVVFTSNAIPVNGNGTYTSAPGFTPTVAGTYRWRAFYSGDANNAAVSGACGEAGESVDITSTTTPSFNKAFSPTTIADGGTSTLTFTVTNPPTNNPAQAVSFIDNLPSGLKIAATPNVQQTCTGGTITANAGATTITVTGVTVSASTAVASTCTVKVDVTNQTGQFNPSCASFPVAFTNQGAANPPSNISGLVNLNDAVTQSCIVVNTFTLGITKTPSVGIVAPGQPLSFTIVVTNNGPSAVNGAIITDPAIPFYTVSNVVCVGTTGGSSCPAPLTVAALQGAGMTVATFPAGATITLRIDGVASLASGQLVNVASVKPPPGIPGGAVSATAVVAQWDPRRSKRYQR